MCIISKRVLAVSNTQILCAVNADRTRQLIVYENKVNSIEANAMILPVRNPETLDFLDLSEYKLLFADCRNCFSKLGPDLKSRSKRKSTDSAPLAVFSVGSYNVSVAQTIEDLNRVDETVFTMSSELEHLLSEYVGYGFIICQLKPGEHQYHPFAYSHAITEQKVFIPTKHYHPSDINTNELEVVTDDWDHTIYLFNVPKSRKMESMNSNRELEWNGTDELKRDRINFQFGKCNSFYKVDIQGTHSNTDLICVV